MEFEGDSSSNGKEASEVTEAQERYGYSEKNERYIRLVVQNSLKFLNYLMLAFSELP